MNSRHFKSNKVTGYQVTGILMIAHSRHFLRYMLTIFAIMTILVSCWKEGMAPQKTRNTNTGSIQQLPYDRWIKPAGKLIIMGDSTKENHTLHSTLSPDKKWLAVLERYSIVFINTDNNEIAYIFRPDSIKELNKAMMTYSGICWYPGKENNYLFFSASLKSGKSFVVQLDWNGLKAVVVKILEYNALPPAKLALPNEIIARNESGQGYLYVVLNGNNQLLKQDIQTGDTIWIAQTGIAPYGLTPARDKLYVTNWAGRVPQPDDPHVAGVPWGKARIDTATAATREGSVTVFDPVTGKMLKEIVTGLHPNAITSSPDGNFVYLTNSNSDRVSVIDTKNDEISETISVRLAGAMNSYFGDSPNGLAVSPDGKTLYVANGMDNALAVVSLGKKAATAAASEKSRVEGFIPTAAYPSSISILDNILYVTNLESFGPNKPFAFVKDHVPAYNAHHMLASISVIDIPDKETLEDYTETVIAANQLQRLESLKLQPRDKVAPVPLPQHIGEPSVFKHVLYIIKENRTYDQLLGDVAEGDGDSTLCTFGEKVTPNLHKLVKRFGLMDNFSVSGKCSAEGHSWTDAAIVTDYIEKNVRAWFRSYPHVLYDALVYGPTGYIWDNARKHGISTMIYGEASMASFNDSLTWHDIYTDFVNGKKFEFTNTSSLNTVEPVLSASYPAGSSYMIPDVLRAATFIEELKHYESMDGDSLPQFMIMSLPDDHTAGTRPGFPTPRAMVADNDLALGRIVEAITHSRFWKNTVIFVVEDDSQNGWDHVSAYRTVALVISPYSKKGTIHTAYNQPSMVRTIEQILGMQPMNIQDAIAEPMFDCFTTSPDFSPWTALPNQVPLDEMNLALDELQGTARHYAEVSLDPQFDGIDNGDDMLFNRILWYALKGDTPYPEAFSGNTRDDD